MKKIVLTLVVALAFPLSSLSADTPAGDFKGEQVKIKSQLEELFADSKKVNAAGPERKPARNKIENAMDWDQVAKDCLGTTEWNKASASNRNEYRNLLREVVVKTAFTRLDKFWDGASYKFKKIDVKGDKAQATAVFKVKDEDFTLDYYLLKQGNTWKLYDVALEDIRYSENIREQIKAFLKEKGFSSLLGKLRKKRDELDEGAKTKKG